jgi:RNA 2',3'-cyclic 3'-phosphodiesterase
VSLALPEARLFVALEPSVDALQAVLTSTAALRSGPLGEAPLRWSNPEGWHVTLAFLGNVEVGLVPALRDLLPRLSPRRKAPRLTFDGLMGFPDDASLRVLVRGVAGEGVPELESLASELRDALAELGLASETPEPYVPHLTLARARSEALDLAVYGASVEVVRWEPIALTLFESRVEAGRRRYVPLASVAW